MAHKPKYWRVSPLFLPLAGLGLGLALTACINDRPAPQTDAQIEMALHVGDTAAARVGDTFIYDSDVISAARANGTLAEGESLMPHSDEFRAVLDELIDRRLLKLAALESRLDKDLVIMRRLAEARESVLARSFAERRLEAHVTDAALRKIYDNQSALRQNGQEANLRLIRAASESRIKEAVAKLAEGADFGELAREISTEEVSRANDGELGWVSRAMLSDGVSDVVFTTDSGSLSEPFKTDDGWYIVEVLGFRKPQQASFEAMREQLRRYKTYDEVQKLMTGLRDGTDIEILTHKSIEMTPHE